MEGFVQIDACMNRCEAIASDVARTLAVWKGASNVQDGSVVGTPRSDGLNDVKVDVAKVSELLKNETDVKKRKILKQYIQTQPSSLSEGTVLKDYQLLGVNWLNLLYSKRIGCILADEMGKSLDLPFLKTTSTHSYVGLGKTIQVIAFIAALKERGIAGPHLIFVPASTLENWTREFRRFAPDIDVQTYYGSQAERAGLRSDLKAQFKRGELEVVLASYTQMTSADDLSFFRKKIDFEVRSTTVNYLCHSHCSPVGVFRLVFMTRAIDLRVVQPRHTPICFLSNQNGVCSSPVPLYRTTCKNWLYVLSLD